MFDPECGYPVTIGCCCPGNEGCRGGGGGGGGGMPYVEGCFTEEVEDLLLPRESR